MKKIVLTLSLALASPLLIAQTEQLPLPNKDNTKVEGPTTTDNGQTSGSARSGQNSIGATGNPNNQSAKTRTRSGIDTPFGKLDLNSDGKLSKDEIKAQPSISAKFKEMDKNSDGSITEPEFSALEAKKPDTSTQGSDRTDKDDELDRKLNGN